MLDFEKMGAEGHEEVVFFSDPSCGLRAIVAIHDTTLGPALGGTRIWDYRDLGEAVEDVLRLSRGMTYKASISNLNLGGGKAVIMGDPAAVKSEALLRSYGRYVESLNGRYITAEDVNMSVDDIGHILAETDHVTGVAQVHGGSGNPAPWTALGVLRGMEACCLKVYGDRRLEGRSVAVQGAGAVGTFLGELLAKEKAKVFVCDIDEEHLRLFKERVPSAEVVDHDGVYDLPCDIYSPCALGATLNDDTVGRLKCRIVAGSANNQLRERRHGTELGDRGVLYATDYLINAGGLMNVSIEFDGWSPEKARAMVDRIYDTTLGILRTAEREGVHVCRATDLLAERRIEAMRGISGRFLGRHADSRLPPPRRRG